MSSDRSSRSSRPSGDRRAGSSGSKGAPSGRSTGGKGNRGAKSGTGGGTHRGSGSGSGRGRSGSAGGGSRSSSSSRGRGASSGGGARRSGSSGSARGSGGSSRSTGAPSGRSGGRKPGSNSYGSKGGARRSSSKPYRDGTQSGGGAPSRRGAPDRPLTAAERKAREVDARRGARAPRDPDAERQRIEARSVEQWIDEGSVRDVAESAAERAAAPARRAPRPLDPEVSSELVEALGPQRGNRLAERLAMASEALDRERFDEARRISSSIVKEAPTIAAAREVLGLASYRLGFYKPAVRELEAAQDLRPDPALLPVIADSYRALRRWSGVERTWQAIKAASPAQEVMAEGRIVAAGALADRGDLAAAIEMMEPATKPPKRVRDHHLRQWYVLGDLHDRVGDAIGAKRWFGAVAERDAEFSDVTDRLRALGR